MNILSPRILLHAEGAAVLAFACYGFFRTGQSWNWFAGLLFVPDLFALGYAFGPKVGAFSYNLAHTYAVPFATLAVFHALQRADLVWILFIWAAHIGMDRMLGYGLKYPTHFKDSHLSRA